MENEPDWRRFEAWVFDLDGTLYSQRPLRLLMGRDLLLHALRHPGRASDLRILALFRSERERLAEEEVQGIGRLQYERAARRAGCNPERVEALVAEWIERRPLRYLPKFRTAGAGSLFRALRELRRPVGVLSDYPAERKLEALGLEADIAVAATDPAVDRLKPHPAGVRHLLERLEVEPGAALLIGDRLERDGECARRAGTAFLLRGSASSARVPAVIDFRALAIRLRRG